MSRSGRASQGFRKEQLTERVPRRLDRQGRHAAHDAARDRRARTTRLSPRRTSRRSAARAERLGVDATPCSRAGRADRGRRADRARPPRARHRRSLGRLLRAPRAPVRACGAGRAVAAHQAVAVRLWREPLPDARESRDPGRPRVPRRLRACDARGHRSSSRASGSGRSTRRSRACAERRTGSTTCRARRSLPRMLAAPVRFLPAFDSIILAHRDRRGSCRPSTSTSSSTRRTRRRRTRSRSTASSPAPGGSRRSASSVEPFAPLPARVAARGRRRGRAAARLVPRLDAKSVSSGSRSPRSTARSTSTQSMPRLSASADRLRLDLLRDEDSRGRRRVTGRRGCSRGSG